MGYRAVIGSFFVLEGSLREPLGIAGLHGEPGRAIKHQYHTHQGTHLYGLIGPVKDRGKGKTGSKEKLKRWREGKSRNERRKGVKKARKERTKLQKEKGEKKMVKWVSGFDLVLLPRGLSLIRSISGALTEALKYLLQTDDRPPRGSRPPLYPVVAPRQGALVRLSLSSLERRGKEVESLCNCCSLQT